MAMGWFNHLAGGRAIAWSGGSEPGTEVNAAAVLAMAEVGIDIAKEVPKPWTEEIVRAADVVITMGCGDTCPLYPGKRYEDWELEDPSTPSVPSVTTSRYACAGSSPRSASHSTHDTGIGNAGLSAANFRTCLTSFAWALTANWRGSIGRSWASSRWSGNVWRLRPMPSSPATAMRRRCWSSGTS
jgi:hypothetical protein